MNRMNVRRFAVLAVVILCVSMLAGCMRMSVTMKVKNNGKVDISMLVGAKNMGSETSESSSANSEKTEEAKKKLEQEGWEYKEYNEDGYIGYIITKRDIEMDEVSKNLDASSDVDTNPDKFVITKNGNKYTLSWDAMSGDNSSQASQYTNYITSSGGYFKFVLELPNKPISSNATSVSDDGKTLTWDLLSMASGQKIEAEFTIGIPLYVYIIIGAVAVLVIVAVCVIIARRRRY